MSKAAVRSSTTGTEISPLLEADGFSAEKCHVLILFFSIKDE